MSAFPAGAARVIACLAFAFMVSMFFRGAMGVVAPELMAELSIDPARMGFVTGAYFLVFALCMIPAGIALDRFGPRATIACLSLIAVGGCLVFATASGWAGLAAGRALLGLACVATLMGAVATLSRWVEPVRLGFAVALISAAGNLGGLLTTLPMALATQWLGWRGVYQLLAVLAAMVAVAVWFGVRDRPGGQRLESTGESFADVLRGVRDVFRLPFVLPIAAMQMTLYPTVATITALWGGPYLADVHGLGPSERGLVLMAMAGVGVVGALVIGGLDRRFNTRRGVVMGLAGVSIAGMLPLALWGGWPLWLATLWLCVIGAVAGSVSVLHTHMRALLPERIAGRGLATLNAFNIGGAYVLQQATGFLVGHWREASGAAPVIAYQLVFGLLAVSLACGIWVYRTVPDVKPGA